MVSAFQDNADKGRDHERICPFAECRGVGDRVEVRVPAIEVCVEVKQNRSFRGWPYLASWSIE
jgi:hypothetical protein